MPIRLLIRLLNICSLLLLVDLFGALPQTQSVILRGDLPILSAFFLTAIASKKEKKAKMMFKHGTGKYISFILLLIAVSALVTLLRGGVNLIDLAKVIRIYFPYLLYFSIYYDIVSNRGRGFYTNLVIVFAGIATVIMILIAVFNVDFFSNWPRISYGIQEGQYDFGLRRVYLVNSFVMPILAFNITAFHFVLLRRRRSLLLMSFFLLGMILQGFRSYIIATLISIVIVLFINRKYLRKRKRGQLRSLFQLAIVSTIIIALFSSAFHIKGLTGRIYSGITDFVSLGGTFGARIVYDAYRFELLMKNPILGIGLVHNNSEKARQLGASTSEELFVHRDASPQERLKAGFYSLRSTDSGYLDLLMQFGILGAGIFFYLIVMLVLRHVSIIRRCDYRLSHVSLAATAMIMIISFTQVSHGGFTNIYGIVPLVLVLALSEACGVTGKA